MGFNVSHEHVRYPPVISPLPKARRDVVLTEVSLKELRFYVKTYIHPNPTQTYKAGRMQFKISGALCQGTFWNIFQYIQ